MGITRRKYVGTGLLASGLGLLSRLGFADGQDPHAGHAPVPTPTPPAEPRARATPVRTPAKSRLPYTPVVTPNGSALPWVMKGGVKEFHLVAEEVKREFAPGMLVNCWGYNGQTPGPTIEAVEGDRVRILVTNRLKEHTTIHWHGIFLPNGMDGVGGLNQPQIKPGETFAYEFTLRQHGTHMYHPHADEMVQMAMGMMGFFVIHPKRPDPERPPADRDFCLFPHMWFVEPGTMTPNPNVMLDFNIFTFNSRAFPGIDPLVVGLGDRVRIRLANLSMTDHPIHIHGHRFWVVETDGGQIPKSGWWPETTLNIMPGTTRAVEFVADYEGDWAFHCHKNHHVMNAMGHDTPNVIGMEQDAVAESIRRLVPGYMAMGSAGMAEHAEHAKHMPGLPNTLPMMTGDGPFGPIEMGGMFTVFKVRAGLASYDVDPGWYANPPGTVAWKV
ncbi:MAG: copper oxidase [Vicinamibacteria bacterium]|jgi:FtsP/CotA-like multicopper oxidase with cupredoxin domain|nr:copper oxidase [Vicinamibacteria bacterium]